MRRATRWGLPLIALAGAAAVCRAGTIGPVETGMVEVAQPAIYYEAAGRGAPVILIHGGQLDRRMWDDQFETFAARYRVVRYDVHGYGRSATPAAPWSAVSDLLALMDRLAIRRAALVGLSLGGRIAIDFALEHPDRVGALVLSGPGLGGFHSDDEAKEEASFWAIVKAVRDESPEKGAELWLKSGYMAPAMEDPALADRLRRISLDNARCWLVNPILERDLDPPAAGRLAGVRAPALVLVGDRDVPVIQQIARKLAAEIPGATRVVVPGAGHMLNMEKPAEFNRLALDFLAKQPAW